MKQMLRFAINLKKEEAKGNSFAQVQHDGVTIQNVGKFQGIAIQYIAPGMEENFVICIGFGRCMISTSDSVARKVEKALINMCDIKSGTLLETGEMPCVGTMRSDGGAASVANYFEEMEGEICYMHGFDKMGAAALADLTRTAKGKETNPWPWGQQLSKIMQDIGTHFSRGGDPK